MTVTVVKFLRYMLILRLNSEITLLPVKSWAICVYVREYHVIYGSACVLCPFATRPCRVDGIIPAQISRCSE